MRESRGSAWKESKEADERGYKEVRGDCVSPCESGDERRRGREGEQNQQHGRKSIERNVEHTHARGTDDHAHRTVSRDKRQTCGRSSREAVDDSFRDRRRVNYSNEEAKF